MKTSRNMLPPTSAREAARWIGAGTVALALHGAGLWYSGQHSEDVALLTAGPPVEFIELAPLIVDSQAVAAEPAPAVETAETTTEMAAPDDAEIVEELDKPVEQEMAELTPEVLSEPIVEEVRPEPVQEAMAPVEEDIPEAPEAPKPEVIVPKRVERVKPVEKPKPIEKPKPKVVEKPKPKPVEKPKVVEKQKPDPKAIAKAEALKKAKADAKKAAAERAEKKAAAAKAAAKLAASENGKGQATTRRAGGEKGVQGKAAQRGGEGGAAAISNWKGKVERHLARRVARGNLRGSGAATVVFRFTSSGAITSVTISSSSGNPAADKALLAAVRRASPIPAPPPGGPSHLVQPIGF